jgi:hypothetical protein
MKKILTGAVVAVIVVGVASFYAGMSYAKGQTPSRTQFAGAAGQFAGRAGAGRTGGGVTTGQVLSNDGSSMTVQMQDGSTKIVLFGTSTQILKTAQGTQSDLAKGTNVVVTGSANSDGSITAQNIQVRPAGTPGGMGRSGAPASTQGQ